MGDLAGGRAPVEQGGTHEAAHEHEIARIAEAVRLEVDAHAALISRVAGDDSLEIVAVSGTVNGPDPTGTLWSRADLEHSLRASDQRGRVHVVTRRAVSDVDDPADSPFAVGGSTVLLIPLEADGDLVGVLATVGYIDPALLDEEGLERLGLYADQARLAIDLLREHRRRIEHERLTSAAQTLVYDALEQVDLRSLVSALTHSLADVMRSPGAWVCAEVVSGIHDQGVSHPAELADRLGADLCSVLQPLVTLCWAERRTLSEGESPELAAIAARVGDDHALVAAVGSGDLASGALLVLRDAQQGAWTPQERDTLAGLGRRLGWVIEQLEARRRDRHLVAELREVDQYRRDLVASLTHDLKTPLTAIALNAELLEADPAVQPGAAPVDAIRRSAQRLSSLVDDLLALARAEEGLGPVNDVGADGSARRADALVHEACRYAEVEAQLRGVRYVLDLPESLPVAVDGSALARVYVNVIHNAVKFSHPGGEVRIRLRAVTAGVELTCSDDGIGIAEADQAAVFDMFRRGRDSGGVPGTGVGLAISQRIITRLGGSISVASRPGEGSTFTVTVPAPR